MKEKLTKNKKVKCPHEMLVTLLFLSTNKITDGNMRDGIERLKKLCEDVKIEMKGKKEFGNYKSE